MSAAMDFLKNVTLALMIRLQVPIRRNHHQDNPIELGLSVDLDNTSTPCIFNHRQGRAGIIHPDDPDLMYFTSPVIGTNTNVQRMLQGPVQDTPEFHFILSVIIHELTHYYQRDEDSFRLNYIPFAALQNNYLTYISQQCELDAHAVQALYYLKATNYQHLDTVLQENDPLLLKRNLINAFNDARGLPAVF